MSVRLLTEHNLEFLRLKRCCTGSSESALVKMPHVISYTMACPPVRGDNSRALASELSYVQLDKHGITILYHLHQCRPCTSSDISC